MEPKTTNVSLDSVEQELYQKRKKIYPREVHGLFANLRVTAVLALLGLYYFIPWINYDGHQSVLFDLPARKFYILGLTFWPQDFFYLAWLLVIAALSLFFFTALAGRLWCGYACPQTVWTEVFLWMERKIEGDRSKQMKLDKSAFNANKFRVKAIKHSVWIIFSLWTGFTFVGYFTPIRELGAAVYPFQLGPWETFWILFYGFATYGNAGWLREQVCIYMCPYARFQSAMFDKDTLIISYDEARGEPRGSRKRNADPKQAGLGDCIDCTMCVQVCPTGIDIRNGLQYQCIGCAACVDVCDDVMDKMGYSKGLIRYTTENILHHQGQHVLRFRTIFYAAVLVALTVGLFYAISQRIPVELDIIRDRNSLYRETNLGYIENVYTLKLINMDEQAHVYDLQVTGLPEMELDTGNVIISVPAGEVFGLPVRVRIDPVHLKNASNTIEFTLTSRENPAITTTQTGRFLGPAGG